MPRSLLWPDPRVKPPYGAAEMDWGHPLATMLVGYWLCNEDGGPTLYDLASLPHRGSLINGPARIGGTAGIALQLNGSSQYADMGDPSSGSLDMGTDDWSVAALIRPTASQVGEIVNKRTVTGEVGYDFYWYHDNSQVVARIGEGSVELFTTSATNSVPLNALSFVSATWDRDGMLTAYVNGRASGTPTDITSMSGSQSNNQDFVIGGRKATGTLYFPGAIGFVYVYRRVLSASENLWLAAEPYAMLRPIVRRRYFVPGVSYPRLERSRRGLERGLLIGAGT